MTAISKIQLFEYPEQHVLSIRKTINFSDYPAIARRSYEEIMMYAAQQGLLFSNGPYVCYHNADLEKLDVELGFPIARPVSGDGEILGHTIPAQKVVSSIFLGAYEDTDPLLLEIMQWIAKHGLEQKGTIFNYYLNEGDRPTNELLTQIVVPVK
jgi:effector-binding domain-containing protein